MTDTIVSEKERKWPNEDITALCMNRRLRDQLSLLVTKAQRGEECSYVEVCKTALIDTEGHPAAHGYSTFLNYVVDWLAFGCLCRAAHFLSGVFKFPCVILINTG